MEKESLFQLDFILLILSFSISSISAILKRPKQRATEEYKRIQLIRPAVCYSTHYTALGLWLQQSLSGLAFKGWQSLTTVHGFVMKPNVPFLLWPKPTPDFSFILLNNPSQTAAFASESFVCPNSVSNSLIIQACLRDDNLYRKV